MTLYFVEIDHGTFVETDRLTNSRKHTVSLIAAGEWHADVTRVLEVNEDEGACRDVTEDMAREVLERLDTNYDHVPSFLRDWIDTQLGAGAADAHDARVHSAAA